MKPNEFRIGNYLIYEATTHTVCGIKDDMVYSWWVKDRKPVIEKAQKDIGGALVLNPYFDVIQNYLPIPIIEEWLLRFGFEKHKISGSYIKTVGIKKGYGFRFHTQNPTRSDIFNDVTEVYYFEQPLHVLNGVKYVHQLQNLYYALTGNELIQ